MSNIFAPLVLLLLLNVLPCIANGGQPLYTQPASESDSLETVAIPVRDPFILADATTRTYYLYAQTANRQGEAGRGKGVEVYTSKDLRHWTKPVLVFQTPEDFWAKSDIWAPEVHQYNGKYYLLTTFTSADTLVREPGRSLPRRGTQILVADSPLGPFRPFANRPQTPFDELCLDGTLFIDGKQPYLVYCHEWLQLGTGTIDALPLVNDLSAAQGQPVVLFKGTDASWVKPLTVNLSGRKYTGVVTDGPWLYLTKRGQLLMLWSSFGQQGYAIGIAVSKTGKLSGPWHQEPIPLFKANGGHGMLFRSFEGQLMLALHQPNNTPFERVQLIHFVEKKDRLYLQP